MLEPTTAALRSRSKSHSVSFSGQKQTQLASRTTGSLYCSADESIGRSWRNCVISRPDPPGCPCPFPIR